MLKMNYNQDVHVFIPPSDTMVIPWSDILEINFIEREIRREQRAATSRFPRREEIDFKNVGKVSFFEMGIPVGQGYWGPSIGVYMNYGLGYSFSHNHQLYGLLGVRVSGAPYMGLVPVGIEYRGRIKPQGKSFMYFAKAGLNPGVIATDYQWNMNSTFDAGPFGSIGFGWTKKRRSKTSFYSKFAYHVQSFQASYDTNNFRFEDFPLEHVEEKGIMHSFDFTVGLGFN